MSFFGSLILFYPGAPPAVTVAQLVQLGSELRTLVGTQPERPCDVQFKFGDKIDQDYQSTSQVDWDESGMIGSFRKYDWDTAWHGVRWDALPSGLKSDSRLVYRGFLNLGSLVQDAIDSLTRWSEEDPRSGICPDSMSLQIDPVCPMTLGDEESVCAGMIQVSFSGNGYFSWGPSWEEYAEQYASAAPVSEAIRVTRRLFPVSASESVDRIAEHLGDRFLNRHYYRPGDWILSVHES